MPFEVGEFLVSDAYTLLDWHGYAQMLEDDSPDLTHVRTLRSSIGELPFIFDQHHPSHLEFLSRTRAFSRQLGRLLNLEFMVSGMPAWSAVRPPPVGKRGAQKFLFLVCPLFFSSVRVDSNRMTWSPNVHEFCLHFDERWKFQALRFKVIGNSEPQVFRRDLAHALIASHCDLEVASKDPQQMARAIFQIMAGFRDRLALMATTPSAPTTA